jgi:phthalate 4,5-cis-dihydrodiol dehydrogenase
LIQRWHYNNLLEVNVARHNVLLVGCGEHSMENLVPSLAGIESVQIRGLCDNSQAAVDLASRWFPLAKAICTESLSLADLDPYTAVVVAATPQVHEHVASLAVERGIPVFVEKPPVVYTKQLETIASVAEKKGVITCVGHNLRHSDAATQFQNAIASSAFGRPVAMEMRYFASKPRGTRWGLTSPLRSFLLSHANHAIDLMIYHMGNIRQIVAARAWPDVDGGVAIAVQFIFESGAVGNLLASSYASRFTVAASVLSDAGYVATMNGLHEVVVQGPNELGKGWSDTWHPRTLETGHRFAGYQTELERFFMGVANGTPDRVRPSFRDEVEIYHAMDLIEASIQSEPSADAGRVLP